MSQPRHPLRVNVGFLLNQPIGASRDINFEYATLALDDLEVSDFAGTARFSRTPQGILVSGQFTGSAELECVRCLKDFWHPLEIEFNELYAFNEDSMTDSGLLLPENGNIDLEDIVREYLVLEVPISPLHREDCRGLCPVCGVDLNLEPPDHSHENSPEE